MKMECSSAETKMSQSLITTGRTPCFMHSMHSFTRFFFPSYNASTNEHLNYFTTHINRLSEGLMLIFPCDISRLLSRTNIEREIQGLKEIVPLGPTEIWKPLGPGYIPGWYAWEGLGGRKDECEIQSFNASYIDIMAKNYADIRGKMNKTSRWINSMLCNKAILYLSNVDRPVTEC